MSEHKSAKDVVDSSYVTIHTTRETVDLNSTDGIRKAIMANTQAIRALAAHIDGDKEPVKEKPVVVEDKPSPLFGKTA